VRFAKTINKPGPSCNTSALTRNLSGRQPATPLESVTDADAIIVQALVVSSALITLISSAVHAKYGLAVRQVLKSAEHAPMFGDGDAKRRAGVKQLGTAEGGQRWCTVQAPIVYGATDKRFEKQPMGDRQRQGDVGIGKADPAREVDGTAELKPGQEVEAITGPQADLNLGITTYLNGTLTSNIVIDTTQAATDTIDYVAANRILLSMRHEIGSSADTRHDPLRKRFHKFFGLLPSQRIQMPDIKMQF
jgi:hypothetical protein